MTWLLTGPRVKSYTNNELTSGKYSNWYQEKYFFGVCVSQEQK